MNKSKDFGFELLPEAAVLLDRDLNISAVNNTFCNLFGCTEAETEAKSFSFFANLSQSMLNELVEDFSDKKVFQTDIVLKQDEKISARLSVSKNGEFYSVVIVPLSELTFLSQAHSDFISTVSHELRTPLTSIKGFIDTLVTAGDRLDKSQKDRFLLIIKTQIERLSRLVENLLAVSKLESQKDRTILKEVRLQKFIEDVVVTIKQKAADHQFEINVASNMPLIWTDSDKLEQILINLLDNAVKYSYPNTTVTIEAGFSSDKRDFAQIKVKDQGVGIPAQSLKNIFTKFSRIDNPLTRNVQGSGLGLYITKNLVEGLGGDIFAESSESGTIFTVMLPLASAERHISDKFYEKG